jgi:peptidoglycan/LPS O-acetylase OafA/YrhL
VGRDVPPSLGEPPLASWRLNLSLGAGRFASCFVAGVVCYTMVGERRRLPFWTLPLALVGGLGVYMLAYARVGMQAGLGIPTTLGLALLLPLFERMQTSWLRRASHVVANYSYGIYLFHAPCIWIAFGRLKFLGTAGCAVTFVLLLAATTWVFYHSLEAPMIRLGQRVAARVA